jgi:hypothetical protein
VGEEPSGSPWLWVRIALVVFVLAWILGPSELRDAIPILPVFLVALGVELHFLVSALRGGPQRAPDRRPQEVDRERYGFEREPDEIVVVDHEGSDVWLAVSEETDEEDTPTEEDEDEDEDDDDEWLEPGPPSRLAPIRRFALGLGVIVVLALTIWFVESRTGWDSLDGDTKAAAVARFSDEASRIAEKPVSIRCDESRDYVGAVQHADGVAIVGGDLALLTPEICHDLYRLAFEDETTGARTGRALAVLAHEAWHLRGERDEGTTECYALQSGVELGVRFGLSESTARQLMRQQLTENATRGAGSIEYRVSAECRDGSRLDLDPDGTDFP